MFPDMTAQLALQDGLQKCAHFGFLARREKFHAAVAQISDGAGYIKAFCDLPDRIAEANSLDVALVKDLNGCSHATARFIRQRGNCQRDYSPGAGAGRSGSGNSSGGGTRRGSSELKLNCSASDAGGERAASVRAVAVEATSIGEAGVISSLAT